jgi:hypothetical protein
MSPITCSSTRSPRCSRTVDSNLANGGKGQPWEEFRDRYRDSGGDLVLWFGRKPCGLTLRALAQRVGGLDYTSVGLGVKRFEQRLLVNKKLRHLSDQVDKALRL